MTSRRDAILRGTGAAATALDALQLRKHLEPAGLSVDVFGVIDDLGLPLVFRPLDALLGACVRVSDGRVGIIVTTERDLHLQRFTAAHELGHFLLEHEGSLDREIGYPGKTRSHDPQEIEANAFASEFLMPSWLCRSIAARHGWADSRLREPDAVYQMSLRMAVSYEAACWGLAAQNLMTYEEASMLAEIPPKKTKARELEGVNLQDPWADVWVLNESDSGRLISAGPGDVLILSLTEHSGSGYLWEVAELEASGFHILSDCREGAAPSMIGGPTRRKVTISVPAEGIRHISLAEKRPWMNAEAPASVFSLAVSSFGREKEGRFQRSPQHMGALAQ